jgi:hypothetical protein
MMTTFDVNIKSKYNDNFWLTAFVDNNKHLFI